MEGGENVCSVSSLAGILERARHLASPSLSFAASMWSVYSLPVVRTVQLVLHEISAIKNEKKKKTSSVPYSFPSTASISPFPHRLLNLSELFVCVQ